LVANIFSPIIAFNSSNSCRAFGIESVEELKDKVDEDGQYGWTAWRNYGCCNMDRKDSITELLMKNK
jgi:hypothetical protein